MPAQLIVRTACGSHGSCNELSTGLYVKQKAVVVEQHQQAALSNVCILLTFNRLNLKLNLKSLYGKK